MQSSLPVAVYGASGHTGTFVVQELVRRGINTVAVGRDPSRLPTGLPARVACIDDTVALERAFKDCAVIINCAGPFLDTASPIIEAALHAGCAYLDVTAEQASAQATFDNFHRRAVDSTVPVIPAAAFYGGLADLLASAIINNNHTADVTIAIALDHWWPTEGTRRTGERNNVPRVVIQNGQQVPLSSNPGSREWRFGPPHGAQPMLEMPFAEIITIAHHLDVRSVRTYLNTSSLNDVRDASTPPPTAVDSHGRSAQRFAMDVVVSDASGIRRATARGQDIYAVTAPIVVEAAARLLDSQNWTGGALSLGQAFDAREFLDALSPSHCTVEYSPY